MSISDRAAQLVAARTPFVRATVVRAQQPTSARPGDEAILLADGTIEGFVGGHCAQNSVRKAAMGVLQAGESVLLRVLPDGDVHFPEAPGACVVVNPCLAGGSLEIFLTPQLPAPLIQIYGETPIADALIELCGLLGYDARRDTDPADTDALPTAIVIASHGGPEAEIIRTALDNGVGYVGLVASTVRGASILDSLDLSDAERARVHTPVGLAIGAKGVGGRERRRMTATQITGVVLAAGRSNRLGTPKQLLPYRDTTVLGATLDVARQAGFDQLILTLGGAASAVRAAMALDGTDVVVVEDVERGCAASLRVALARVHPRATGIVLMLGDQPQVAPATLRRIIDVGPATEIMVCRYADGVGHPFWFSRTVFGELARLHGDKGVWKLVHSGRHPVRELAVDGCVPLDVDTWDDYRRLLESVPS